MRAKLIFVAILILATFLRFYRIDENLVFHGELGQNYLAIKDAFLNKELPLLGPPTSHPWLSFGPLFYYIFGPFLVLNNWNPNSGAYFFAVLAIIGIVINYFFVKNFFGQQEALISSYLISISFVWLNLARQSRFFSVVIYLFYFFVFITLKTKKDFKYLFWLGLIFGIMLNFHLAPIFLIPALVVIFWSKKKNIKLKYLFQGLIGFIIPNTPILIWNLKNNFEMISKFVIWIPYRAVVYHNFNLLFTFNQIFDFFGGFVLMILILFTLYLERKKVVVKIFALFLFFGVLALILHKDPPIHYFYVLYPIPVILISVLLNKLKPFLRNSFLVLITVISFLYLNKDKVLNEDIPYNLQLIAAHKIVTDANGRDFNLHRVGYSDQFEGEYAQNYKYLLWWMGNEPKDKEVNLSYTIFENKNMQIVKSEK